MHHSEKLTTSLACCRRRHCYHYRLPPPPLPLLRPPRLGLSTPPLLLPLPLPPQGAGRWHPPGRSHRCTVPPDVPPLNSGRGAPAAAGTAVEVGAGTTKAPSPSPLEPSPLPSMLLLLLLLPLCFGFCTAALSPEVSSSGGRRPSSPPPGEGGDGSAAMSWPRLMRSNGCSSCIAWWRLRGGGREASVDADTGIIRTYRGVSDVGK